MDTFITSLQSQLTGAALWAELNPAATLIGAVVLFAFGYFIVKRIIRGVSTGKARI